MKILFINLPYYGHVIPTIGLVKELIKLGCQVTYMLPFDWEDTIKDSGANFCGYKNHRQLAEQMKNAYAAADAIAEQYDGILYEQFFFLGKHLGEKYHKPTARIFTAPATNQKLMEEFIAKGPLSLFRCSWIARAFTKDVAKQIPLKTENWLDEIVCNPPELNLVYALREYQPFEEEFPEEQYRFLGPSIYERETESFDFLKGERPLVYISLGTIMKAGRSFYQSCIDAFREEDVDVIISTGKNFDRKKQKNLPQNIHFYPSVPQLDVLSMADVFVTHCGMNSVSEALVSGTPMVLIPLSSDQPSNARSMEQLGVGRRLEYSAVNGDSLKTAVFSVLTDERMKKNLDEVQKRIECAAGNPGGAKMLMDYIQGKL